MCDRELDAPPASGHCPDCGAAWGARVGAGRDSDLDEPHATVAIDADTLGGAPPGPRTRSEGSIDLDLIDGGEPARLTSEAPGELTNSSTHAVIDPETLASMSAALAAGEPRGAPSLTGDSPAARPLPTDAERTDGDGDPRGMGRSSGRVAWGIVLSLGAAAVIYALLR